MCIIPFTFIGNYAFYLISFVTDFSINISQGSLVNMQGKGVYFVSLKMCSEYYNLLFIPLNILKSEYILFLRKKKKEMSGSVKKKVNFPDLILWGKNLY